jgi:SAM-dependent methyltransferase
LTGREVTKDPGDGEIDFSDAELVEMNAAVAGRDPDAPRRKRRSSMLRVPADEVPRASGPVDSSTDRSLPAFADEDPADELVEHAFHNGGTAEGPVLATPHRLGDEPAGEADAIEAIDEALAHAEADGELDDDAPEIETVEAPPPAESPADAAGGDALAPLSPWGEPPPPLPPSVGGEVGGDGLLSSAPPVGVSSPVVAVAAEVSGEVHGSAVNAKVVRDSAAPMVPARIEDSDGMELESTDMEELDGREPPAPAPAPAPEPPRPRALTPVVVPPPGPIPSMPTPPPPMAPSMSGPISMIPTPPPPLPSVPVPIPAMSTPPPQPSAAVPTTQAAVPTPASPSLPAIVPPPAPPAAPPPTPAAAPPPTPAAAPPPTPTSAADALPARKKRRAKQWFEEIFDDDYLRTLPFLTPRQTEREAHFIAESLGVSRGGTLLDLACGYGRHAMELTQRGFQVTGLDLSLPLLIRAADAARRAGLNVDFIHGDMREISFENAFDGAYCMFTSFGYFDDDTNRKVAANLARAIKPGGRLLLDLVNRDYLVRDVPTRVWWQGDGCVVLEEVDFNYFSSRLQVQRSIIFEDGRQAEQEISIRAYALHEIGKVLHHAGFRVTEVSGGLAARGRFFGADSRQLLVLAEKKGNP